MLSKLFAIRKHDILRKIWLPWRTHSEKGLLAEKIACQYLKSQGLKLLAKNFLVKGGELDLVMLEKDHLVFVEVRSRYEGIEEALISIDQRKQKRIKLAATVFLQKNRKYRDYECRFDVVLLGKDEIRWLKQVFE